MAKLAGKSVAKKTKSKRSTKNSKSPGIEFIARGVFVRAGQVLLCQSIKHKYYYLPGGHVEFGESAAAAVAREILEELGVKARVGPLALVSEGSFIAKRQHHEVNFVFFVEPLAPWPTSLVNPKSREGWIAFRWIDLAAVQDLDIRPLAVKAWIASGLGNGGVEWVSEIAR